MALIHLPQAKWGSGTGRQVILKSDFDKIEQALLESFHVPRGPSPEYVDSAKVRVPATADCKARLMLCGFPSPLHPGQWVSGGLSDGRYRENAVSVTLDFAGSGSLWGTEKPNQWYAVYALAGSGDTTFSLKAMPVMRVSSQAAQIITLRNNADNANIGYGLTANELAEGQILGLTGASRGIARLITANNDDNAEAGTITYGGSALDLAQGDWLMVLPKTNFRRLGMVFNDVAGNLAPFNQEGPRMTYRVPREWFTGAVNGYTLKDLALVAPPTARRLAGFGAALNGYDLKLAISYDGVNPALILHGTPPAYEFQGVRGSIPFSCLISEGNRVYANNDNTANQVAKITGWEE